MAMPPPPSLENLPDDIQGLILNRVPCLVDRARMSLVSRAWCRMIQDHRQRQEPQPQPPRPLPWLLLPASSSIGGIRASCVLSGGLIHHYLNITPPDARIFGSHHGAWLLLETVQPRANLALNVRTGRVIGMPTDLRRRHNDAPPYVHDMTIHAAALSASPDDASCVGAAIATSWTPEPDGVVRRCIAIWRQGSLEAFDYVMPGEEASADVEDVAYNDGEFVFLTRRESVIVCTPIKDAELSTEWFTIRCRPSDRSYDVRARYLLITVVDNPLKDELLMIVRFSDRDDPGTSSFKVFIFEGRNEQQAKSDPNFPDEKYRAEWSELDTLGDLILFVGHGCSRSYRASEYPGFKGGIYFLDDGMFYDDSVIFGNGNVRRYPCSDNGKWSEGHVERCFPRPVPSDHSAPVWLLP